MAEYVNQANVNIAEIARLTFNHVTSDHGADVITELVCAVEFLPALAKVIQDTYDQHIKLIEDMKQTNNTNKILS